MFERTGASHGNSDRQPRNRRTPGTGRAQLAGGTAHRARRSPGAGRGLRRPPRLAPGRPAGPARLPPGTGPAHRPLTRVMRECGAGPGHLARFGWREALRAGPAGWKDILTWRTLRVAAGVLLPLAAGAASGTWNTGPSRRWARCPPGSRRSRG